MTESSPVWTPKPWGGEWLLRKTDTYAVKVLHLRQGCRTSLQYHRIKRETLFPGSGEVRLELHHDGAGTQEILVGPVEVTPGTVHRLVAVTDADVVEVSGVELDDVVRLEDDYGRIERTASGTV